ncbi:MAG: FAD-dependent oxidoreductase [Alphaproteobacteria bacterium]|nr:FAD-dependent oxidoreductase [Alphaproteobacteria bacterium]
MIVQSIQCSHAASTSSIEKINIAIVGGGLSGLTTAKNLCSHVSDIHLFEAKEHLGGRTHTYYWDSEHYFEEGGTTIDSDHTSMISLASELNIPLIKRGMGDGQLSFIYQGRLLSNNDVERIFKEAKDIFSLLGSQEPPSNSSIADVLDTIKDPMVKSFLQTFIKDHYGVDSENLSFFCKDSLLRQITEFYDLVSNRNNPSVLKDMINQCAYTYRVEGGMSRFIQVLRDHIQPKTSIRCGYMLKRISKNDSVYSLEFLAGTERKIILADKVVLTLPFSTLRDIDIELTVALSPLQREVIKTLPYGTNTKIGIPVEGSFDMLHHISLDEQFVSWPGHNTWTVMLGGDVGKNFTQHQSNDLIRDSREALQVAYPDIKNLGQPIIKNWAIDEFAKGSYSASLRINEIYPEIFLQNNDGQYQFSESLDKALFIAGEHTRADSTRGHMEGAVRSGHSCAKAVLSSLYCVEY